MSLLLVLILEVIMWKRNYLEDIVYMLPRCVDGRRDAILNLPLTCQTHSAKLIKCTTPLSYKKHAISHITDTLHRIMLYCVRPILYHVMHVFLEK